MTTEERIKNFRNMSNTLTQISEAIMSHCDELMNIKDENYVWSSVVYHLSMAQDSIDIARDYVDQAINEVPA